MRWFVALLFGLAAGAAWAQPGPDPLRDALYDYGRYQSGLSAVTDAPIASQAALDDVLAQVASASPDDMTRGWIAYGALTAAQSPAFVAGLRARVRAAGRAPVVRQLVRDTTYARRRPAGAQEAIGLILSSTRADAARLTFASERYAELARTIETAGWSALTAEARTARNTRMRAPAPTRGELAAALRVGVLGAAPLTDARAFGGASFWDGLANRPQRPLERSVLAPARLDAIDRMLTLSGLIIVGAETEQPARVEALLDDAQTRECLVLEQLQFRQCVSVSHSGDEDAQCLARHGLSRPAACFAAITR